VLEEEVTGFSDRLAALIDRVATRGLDRPDRRD